MKLISKEEDKNVFVQIEKRTFRVFCGFFICLISIPELGNTLASDPLNNFRYLGLMFFAVCGGLYLIIFTATRTLELDSVHGKLVYIVSHLFRTTRAEFPTSTISSFNIFSSNTSAPFWAPRGTVGTVNKSVSINSMIFLNDGTKVALERVRDVSPDMVTNVMATDAMKETVECLNALSLRIKVPFINGLA